MHRSIIHFGKLAALSLLLGAAPGRAADPVRAKAELAALRARIEALTNRLAADLAQRDALGARVRDAELDITAKRRSLDKLRIAAQAAERRRAAARLELAHTLAALDAQRAALAGQIVAAYMIGGQEQLKLLLNQTDPARLGRMLTYYGYLGRARAAQIAAIRARQQGLEALRAEIDQQSLRLKSLQDENRRALAELERARGARVAALAVLARQVTSGDEQLAGLKRQEQALENLLADLARVMQDFPTDAQQNFEQLRGRLPWPVNGRLLAHSSELQNGVLIESPTGAQVRAPYFGRVVYADWLQGMGLLLIIGHNGGYMSLYGHAEVLYKSVGDWVAPGDVIAALSDTAGKPAQLYFEIRRGRRPLDPKQWLQMGH